MLTNDELAAIRERAEKATPGQWVTLEHAPEWIGSDNPYGHGWMHVAETRGWGHLTGCGACGFNEDKAAQIQDANTQFIVHARADVPALLDHIAVLEAERDTALAEVARMRPVVEAAVRWLSDLTEYAELELERTARDYRDKEAKDADKG